MKSNSTAADLAYVAVFAALVIVFAFVSIPIGTAGVPIVLQNAILILSGLILGPRRAFFVAVLFLGLGLGLPVLSGGRTVLSALGGPTVGYILGYLISPAVAGAIAYRAPARRQTAQIGWFALAGAVALLIQYVLGAIGLMLRADMTVAAAAAVQVPFLLPDALKVAVMIAIAVGVHAAFPDFLSRKVTRARNLA